MKQWYEELFENYALKYDQEGFTKGTVGECDFLEEEMTYLYNHPKIKALISMSHGEGFGLPMFEAAYNGLPVIATDWGGQCDFLYMSDKNKKKKAMFTKIPEY